MTCHQAYSLAVALQIVKMRPLQHEIPEFPRVVAFALLHHPTVMIRLANLLQDALARFEIRAILR